MSGRLLVVLLFGWCACGSSPDCMPGHIYACAGPGGCRGRQFCAADGQSFEACNCSFGSDGGR